VNNNWLSPATSNFPTSAREVSHIEPGCTVFASRVT